MIILYISWRRFQNIWNKKIEPFLRTCYHGLKNFQKGFKNNSNQEPPITAVLNFSMYSLLSVYEKINMKILEFSGEKVMSKNFLTFSTVYFIELYCTRIFNLRRSRASLLFFCFWYL